MRGSFCKAPPEPMAITGPHAMESSHLSVTTKGHSAQPLPLWECHQGKHCRGTRMLLAESPWMVIKSSAFYQGQAQRSDLVVRIVLEPTVIGQDPPLGTPLLCHRSWCGFGHPTPNACQWVGSDGLEALCWMEALMLYPWATGSCLLG